MSRDWDCGSSGRKAVAAGARQFAARQSRGPVLQFVRDQQVGGARVNHGSPETAQDITEGEPHTSAGETPS